MGERLIWRCHPHEKPGFWEYLGDEGVTVLVFSLNCTNARWQRAQVFAPLHIPNLGRVAEILEQLCKYDEAGGSVCVPHLVRDNPLIYEAHIAKRTDKPRPDQRSHPFITNQGQMTND
ncbi:hypothetical protein [Coleofasciculus sp. E1-EBD-02]|uniref:hypothetical protein n=1 Tax=Coleofasciculus sp. E1-EBD-02 TaxID=3068481 RepID=UPI00330294BD